MKKLYYFFFLLFSVIEYTRGEECCGGWTGPNCTVRDLCFGVSCKNAGVCNPLTGGCECTSEYTGSFCQLSTCSFNGLEEQAGAGCVCFDGWGGSDCSACESSPRPGWRHVCVYNPEHLENGYRLWVTREERVEKGFFTLTAEKKPKKWPFVLPASRDAQNRYVDCACNIIQDNLDSRKAALAGSTISKTRPLFEAPEESIRMGLQGGARHQRVSEPHRDKIMERLQRDSNHYRREKLRRYEEAKRMRNTWVLPRSATITLRDNEPPFFEDTIDQCIAESSLSTQEKVDLAGLYEECIDVYEATNGDLSKCEEALDACTIDDDDGETCDGLAIAFWPVLAIAILLFFAVVMLTVCFCIRPVKYVYRR